MLKYFKLPMSNKKQIISKKIAPKFCKLFHIFSKFNIALQNRPLQLFLVLYNNVNVESSKYSKGTFTLF